MTWEVCVVGTLALATYLNTLGHDFVYDDNRAILTNPGVQMSTPLMHIFYNDFWGTPLSSSSSHGSYRPICTLTFRLNNWISGYQPLGFHLTNVLLHGVTTTLVLRTARILLPGKAPVMAASLFAVHPIHVEAVAGIVGRADILAAVLFLSSFLFYVRHVKERNAVIYSLTTKKTVKRDDLFRTKCTDTKKSDIFINGLKHFTLLPNGGQMCYLLFLVFAVCAMLSKEPGVTVIPVAVCYDVILHLRSKTCFKLKQCIYSCASKSLVAFIVIVTLRGCIMTHSPTFSKADNPIAKESSDIARVLTFLYLPIFNFYLLIYPKWLSFDWSMDAIPIISSFYDIRLVSALIFYYILYCSLKFSLRFNHRLKARIIKLASCNGYSSFSTVEHYTVCKIISNNNHSSHSGCSSPTSHRLNKKSSLLLCLALIVLPFLPASNLCFYVGFVVAERVLYLPSIGFCMLVAFGVQILWRYHKRLATGGFLLLVVALGARTLQRNGDWRNEEALYRSALHINPPKAYGNLGSVLGAAGRFVEAETALRTALRYRPNMADVHYNLGNLLRRQHKYKEAVESYQTAIHYRPSLAVGYLNLGQSLGDLQRQSEAEVVYRKCALLDVTGMKDPRAHEVARVACLNSLARLCLAHHCQAVTKAAINMKNQKCGRTNQLRSPDDENGVKLQTRSMATNNDTRLLEAEELFLRAIKNSPTDPVPYVTYGQMLARVGRQVEAASVFLEAAQLAPRHHAMVTTAAIALRHAGRLSEAEALYIQAMDLRPKDATSHSNLGAIFHLQGKYQQAASCYREALRIAPGDQITLINLQKLRNLLSWSKR